MRPTQSRPPKEKTSDLNLKSDKLSVNINLYADSYGREMANYLTKKSVHTVRSTFKPNATLANVTFELLV